jgi:hypothetical protein
MPSEERSPNRSSVSDKISSISAAAILSIGDDPDSQTKLESTEIGKEELPHIEIKALANIQEAFARERIRSLSQDIDERKIYAHRIFCLICCWLMGCFLLLIVEGLAHWTQFSLPEGVLMAIIGSTTVDVLGIFYIVTHYLFPQNETPSFPEDSNPPTENN